MISKALKALIPSNNTNLSTEEIVEHTLEAERILNVKFPQSSTSSSSQNRECRKACCLEYVLRKKVNVNIDLKMFAGTIGISLKNLKVEHKKLGFQLDSIVTTTTATTRRTTTKSFSSKNNEDDILVELAMKLCTILVGDSTIMIQKTKLLIHNIKEAMKDTKNKHNTKGDLSQWARNKRRYVCACFYLTAKDNMSKNSEFSDTHICQTQKILQRDFDDAIDFIQKWLKEVPVHVNTMTTNMQGKKNLKRKSSSYTEILNNDKVCNSKHSSLANNKKSSKNMQGNEWEKDCFNPDNSSKKQNKKATNTTLYDATEMESTKKIIDDNIDQNKNSIDADNIDSDSLDNSIKENEENEIDHKKHDKHRHKSSTYNNNYNNNKNMTKQMINEIDSQYAKEEWDKYYKRKQEILDKTVIEIRTKYNDESMCREKALDLAADDALRNLGLE